MRGKMGRKSSDKLLRRSLRYAAPDRRPRCPVCRTHSPDPKSEDFCGVDWLAHFGHRCPHGEPCPSFSPVKGLATVCASCITEGLNPKPREFDFLSPTQTKAGDTDQ